MSASNVQPLRRQQVIAEEVLVAIEEQIALARAGEVVDIAFVCNTVSDDSFHRMSSFADAWRLLGALEYAKQTVLRAMVET